MSYRRQDSEWVSLSLFNALKQQFPNDAIFKDVNEIRAGEDFTKALESNLQSCDVLLVVIGTEWVSCRNSAGRQRLFEPEDVVCLEVASALRKNKKVIPVLVNNTIMPAASELPAPIKDLHNRQAVRINNSNFEMDVFSLANAINMAMGKPNQYADMVKDIASGKVNQKELIKPESNAAYAMVCTGLGLLILFLNSDSTAFVIICGLMALAGVYAYFLSRSVQGLWLNKSFEAARRAAKNTKLISLIAPTGGIILLVIVVLLQSLQFFANGGMKDVNKIMEQISKDSIQRSNEAQQNTVVPVVDQATSNDQAKAPTKYIIARNTLMYQSANVNEEPVNILYANNVVTVLEYDRPFAKIQYQESNGEFYTCWIKSEDLQVSE